MKVKINVECTPDEARAFLGLPDVTPLQDDMLNKMREQMDAAAEAMNPEQMMKTIFPAGLPAGTEGLADLQNMFWSAFSGDAMGQSGKGSKKKK